MKAFERAALAAVFAAITYSADSFNLPTSSSHHPPKLIGSSRVTNNNNLILPSFTTSHHELPSTRLYSTLEKPKSAESSASSEDSSIPSSTPPEPEPEPEPTPNKILGEPIPYSDLTIGILKESYPGENRVSVAPESVKMLVDAGLKVVVESGGKFVEV